MYKWGTNMPAFKLIVVEGQVLRIAINPAAPLSLRRVASTFEAMNAYKK